MKAKALSPVAVAAAREVLAAADVRTPRDIDVHAIAARRGVMVLYGEMRTARASLVRAGKRAIVRVDEEARGQPRAAFTVAHELGHFLLHAEVDHFAQCESEEDARARGGEKQERRGAAWRIEAEANHFSTELRMPEALAGPLCRSASPTLDDVVRLTTLFPTSLTSAGLRYTQLAVGGCAWVLSAAGAVKWASESAGFGGKIVKGRAVDRRSAAGEVMGGRGRAGETGRGVPGEAWGGRGAMVEFAVRAGDGVLSFVVEGDQ